MYYPLLRARQFELIALREIAQEGISQAHIIQGKRIKLSLSLALL